MGANNFFRNITIHNWKSNRFNLSKTQTLVLLLKGQCFFKCGPQISCFWITDGLPKMHSPESYPKPHLSEFLLVEPRNLHFNKHLWKIFLYNIGIHCCARKYIFDLKTFYFNIWKISIYRGLLDEWLQNKFKDHKVKRHIVYYKVWISLPSDWNTLFNMMLIISA